MNAPAELPKMLTPADVQKALGGEEVISIRTIQRMAHAKLIPGAVRLGRKLFFQRIPVTQWIEGGGASALRRVS